MYPYELVGYPLLFVEVGLAVLAGGAALLAVLESARRKSGRAVRAKVVKTLEVQT